MENENYSFRTIAWVAFNVIFAIMMMASKNPDVHIWSLPLIINCIIILLTEKGNK